MVIAKKTSNGILLGYTVTSDYIDMTESDIMLFENQPFWQVKDGGPYICASKATRGLDIVRYNDEMFKNVKNGVSLVRFVVPKMKELLEKNDALINGKHWDNELIVIKGKKAFSINRFFIVNELEDFISLPNNAYIEGAMARPGQKDAKEAILNAIRINERMRLRRLFPVTIFDSATGESQIYSR